MEKNKKKEKKEKKLTSSLQFQRNIEWIVTKTRPKNSKILGDIRENFKEN